MGYPMARHLSKEHEVIVWNRTAREGGAPRARARDEARDAISRECADAEVIITMLPTSKEVDEIVDQLLPVVKRGTLWIDATSGDPNVSRETAKRLAEKGVHFVDAPVTGAVVGAENATLTIMIGGERGGFERAKEILHALRQDDHPCRRRSARTRDQGPDEHDHGRDRLDHLGVPAVAKRSAST